MKRYDRVVFVLVTEKTLTDGGGNSMTAGRDVEEARFVGREAESLRRLSSVSSDERHAGGGSGSQETSGGRGGCTMAASSSEEERGDGDLSRRQRCFSSFTWTGHSGAEWSKTAGRIRVQSSPASSSRANREAGEEEEMSGR
jgi:hypothetical protein